MTRSEKPQDINSLVTALLNGIQNKTLANDQGKLPSEYQLMAQYQVSRYALRQALSQLSDLGYIYQVQGVGSFVRPRRVNNTLTVQHNLGLTEEMARPGRTIRTVTASRRKIQAADADFLPENSEVSLQTALIEITRLRTLDDEPYLTEQSYYLEAIANDIPEASLYDSVFDYIETTQKLKIGFIDKVISSEPLNRQGADFFHLPIGAPTLVVRDDTFLSCGKLLAFSKICYDYRKAELFMFKKNY